MRRLARYTAVFIVTIFAVYMVWFFRTVIVLFFLSLALAALFRPIFLRLAERGLPRGLALAVTYASLFVGLAVSGWWLVPMLLTESQELISFFAFQYEVSWDNKEDYAQWQTNILNLLPNPDDFYDSLTGQSEEPPPQSLVNSVSALGTVLGSLPLVVMLSIYWASGQEQFERLWLSLLAAPRRRRARTLWREIETALGVYLRSELFQAVTSFFVLAIGLYFIGYPYPILLSLVASLLMPLPLFGTPLAILAVILGSIFQKSSVTATAAVYTAMVHLFFFVIVEPRLMGKWRYNPLLALFIILLLVEAIGFVGLLLAPPLAALIQITLRTLFRRPEPQPEAKSLEDLRTRVDTVVEDFGDTIPTGFDNIITRLNDLIGQAEQKLNSQQR